MEHELKTWPEYFKAVQSGAKPFEVRRHDRNYEDGDILWLREWEPSDERYTGQEIRVTVTYVLHGIEQFGIHPDFCVMGIETTVVPPSPPATEPEPAPPLFNIDKVTSPGVYDAQDLTGEVTRLVFERDASGLLYAMLGDFKMHASSRAAQRYRFRYVSAVGAEPDPATVKQSLTTETIGTPKPTIPMGAPFTAQRPDREGVWEALSPTGDTEKFTVDEIGPDLGIGIDTGMAFTAFVEITNRHWDGFLWRYIGPLPAQSGEGEG